MSAKDLLAKAASEGVEENVPVAGVSILVRRAAAHEIITATKHAATGDEAAFRLAVACLSITEPDGSRPYVGEDGDLAAGIEALRGLPGGLQISLSGAAMRVNGFSAGN
jgi:hypothetical protein